MADQRIERLARVLVEYSLQVQPEQIVVLQGSPLAEPLLLAVFRRVVEAGANPVVRVNLPGFQEILLSSGNEQQLTRLTTLDRLVPEEADASLSILSDSNTKALSGVDPDKQRMAQTARRDLTRRYMERAAEGTLRWCLTLFPTQAYAQDAEMSLADYQDFVYGACHVDEDGPVAHWQQVSREQARLIDWLAGKREARVTGPETDLRLLIEGRTFINADGARNFPDGEIFTGPVEDSVEGMVRFSYPSIVQGREVEDIRLWFEGGKVVRATAAKNQDYLERMLGTDDGARRLGEFAFGTNAGIQRFTKNILFDEKIGGTVHMAIGAGFPDTGSQNQSAIHWDMICDLRQGGEVTVDGQPFMRDGVILV
ncbi:MAG TPA: aminopeptidase [Thermomicrobiales bacterium]|nr:aminopeptidase [Thermomicrobiales bacterium]